MEGNRHNVHDSDEEEKHYRVERDLEVVKEVSVTEPAWVGDSITGHRTYHVNSIIDSERYKVVRRFSNFEALRNRLITVLPQFIIPILPEKTVAEKYYSDESEEVNKRIRGFERFLEVIRDHPDLSTNIEFIDFLKNSSYSVDATSTENESLEDDTSTVFKYIFSIWDAAKSTITGSEAVLTFSNKVELDHSFDKHLQKLRNLLNFLIELMSNTTELKLLLNRDIDNTRNISTVMKNLQTSISELDDINMDSVDAEMSGLGAYEEEKKANFEASFGRK